MTEKNTCKYCHHWAMMTRWGICTLASEHEANHKTQVMEPVECEGGLKVYIAPKEEDTEVQADLHTRDDFGCNAFEFCEQKDRYNHPWPEDEEPPTC